MPDAVVVLVGPKNEGNVGAVARAMKNFGVDRLVLVNPCPIGDDAYRRAMHGADVLAKARSVKTLDEALEGMDLIVGTTGVSTESEKKFLRIAIPPRELAERVASMEGALALVFGREDFGLLDEELRGCDLLVTIPTADAYPVLNVSHAAAIVLYELRTGRRRGRSRKASGSEKEVLYRAFADLLKASRYPPHKRARTAVMFRRLIGRAVPSKWEFHALMGVLTRSAKSIRRKPGKEAAGQRTKRSR